MFFQSKNSHTCTSFKVSKILKSFDKTAHFYYLQKPYCLLFSITGSNFLLSHTFMILDGQILVTLKYLLTALKPMVDSQCL